MPTAAELEALYTEADRVRAWRVEKLKDVTGSDGAAELLEHAGADWHDVEKMLAGGATLRQVLRIYRP